MPFPILVRDNVLSPEENTTRMFGLLVRSPTPLEFLVYCPRPPSPATTLRRGLGRPPLGRGAVHHTLVSYVTRLLSPRNSNHDDSEDGSRAPLLDNLGRWRRTSRRSSDRRPPEGHPRGGVGPAGMGGGVAVGRLPFSLFICL